MGTDKENKDFDWPYPGLDDLFQNPLVSCLSMAAIICSAIFIIILILSIFVFPGLFL
jgi:hypothetical protein